MAVKIKDMYEYDRPRERLIKYGAINLSDAELLAIIISSGNNKYSAKDIASMILKDIDGLNNLNKLNYESLIKYSGIKNKKAALILAVIEISKRINTRIRHLEGIKLNNTKLVFEYYKNKLKYLNQERFYCVYLDNYKKVIKDKLLFQGTLNYSLVHPREIFKEAYINGATAIICVHNHPSGNVLPSKDDIDITSKIVSIGILHGIKVLDHVIIGKDKYYSFLENNQINL